MIVIFAGAGASAAIGRNRAYPGGTYYPTTAQFAEILPDEIKNGSSVEFVGEEGTLQRWALRRPR